MDYPDRIFELIIKHSCNIREGETVIVECIDVPKAFIGTAIARLSHMGAIPVIIEKSSASLAAFAKHASEEAIRQMADNELFLMKKAKHFIGLRQPGTTDTFADVPADQMKKLLENYLQPVHYEYRNRHLNWVYLRIPTQQMASKVGMDLSEFEEYYYSAVLADYGKMNELMNPLAKQLQEAKIVHIKGPGNTDLVFNLGNFGVYKSTGYHNLPDGEVFTAPGRDSINGTIEFNIDSTYYGTHFSDVKLTFVNGKAVLAEANDSVRLNQLLDIDEGARYIGEFAFGVNPVITKPINDILFDEKINTSLHLALGNAYPVADNGNRSAIHWDLILDQALAKGGGTIALDGKIIRRNGIFTHPELLLLNP